MLLTSLWVWHLISEHHYNIIATMYGEVGSWNEASWKAIANVTMNEVGKYEWSEYTTPYDIITKKG